MRTSNKILLGALLLVLFTFAFPVFLIRARVASGHFITMKREADGPDGKSFEEFTSVQSVKRVEIQGLQQVELFRGDSLHMIINSPHDSLIHYNVKDDVLYVYADSAKNWKNGNGGRAYTPVYLKIPASVDSVFARDAHINIAGITGDSAVHHSYNIELKNAALEVKPNQEETRDKYVIDLLRINAHHESNIAFRSYLNVQKGAYTLGTSQLEDNGLVKYGSLEIRTDSASTFNLKGNTFRKAKITSTE